MVVVPAGTRNHLALDLGLDRDDVVGALDAYGEAVERTMDLADVNGHVFVNNVSLGLYAAIVRSPGVPRRQGGHDPRDPAAGARSGSDAVRPALHRRRRRGPSRRAHVIQISNNPYGETAGGFGSRPRLDTHQLGVVSLVLDKASAARRRSSPPSSTGHPERFEGLTSWATPTFEVTSDAPIEIGLDGETRSWTPPLRFSIRPAPGPGAAPEAGHRLLAGGPLARLEGGRAEHSGTCCSVDPGIPLPNTGTKNRSHSDVA